MQVQKQQVEPDMKQRIASQLGKEYDKTVFYHTVYLTYIQSISYEMPGWMKPTLESRLLTETSTTSYMQMIPY